jgi:uncharacterized membrane protein YkoI
MRNTRKLVVPAIALVVLGLGAGVLLAQQAGQMATQHDKDIVKAMADHKMTLVNAIEAAEQQTQGQALSAMAQMRGNDAVVNVTCLAGDNVKHVTVDVNSGKVTETPQTHRETGPSPTHGKHGQKPVKKP